MAQNQKNHSAIRARLAAIERVLPASMRPVFNAENGVIEDRDGDSILWVNARFCSSAEQEAATEAFLNTPADLQALLDAVDARDEHIADLEAALAWLTLRAINPARTPTSTTVRALVDEYTRRAIAALDDERNDVAHMPPEG